MTDLASALEAAGLERLANPLMERARCIAPHGDQAKWQATLKKLPAITASFYDFTGPAVRIGASQDCDAATKTQLKQQLLQLQPWRKGPFDLFGVRIDSEWRADKKWRRLSAHIGDLRGRRVLDVGCGNGYYLWRMLGQGARIALGIDPAQLFITQFDAIKNYCPASPAFVLPLTSEELAAIDNTGFDTVFSMGVLSHRRNPRRHLRELFGFVRPGGEIVVETLVVDGDADTVDTVLVPPGRYAKMRNVHAIPSPPALAKWLQQTGLTDVALLDVSVTTPAEQRVTEWMRFESLADFLDPNDLHKTIEGHPAPKRAIFRCRRPD